MRFTHDHKALFALLLPLAALACSGGGGDTGSGGSGGSTSTGGAGGSGTTTSTNTSTAGSGGGTGGSTMECPGPGFGGNEKDVDVGIVTATVIDQNGSPAAGVIVQVCGTDLCLSDKTNASGNANMNINKVLKSPAFKYGEGIDYAKFAIPVAAGDTALGSIETLKLAAVGTGDHFAPGASASSNGVVIDVPAGGSVKIDTLTYEDETQQTFRVLLAPAGANIPIDPAFGVEIVYGAAPLETRFCPPAKMHVPNSLGWTAGAAVEFLIQGLDVAQDWAPYGEWQKVSDGAVSADGKEIVTADGQGIPLLSSFGLRLKQ